MNLCSFLYSRMVRFSVENLEALVEIALKEDLGEKGDVTSLALIDPQTHSTISMVSRSNGIFAGVTPAKIVAKKVDPNLEIKFNINDGDTVKAGTTIAQISGNLQSILKAERTMLNFVQHLSGIAKLTREFKDLISSCGSTTEIRDTRKTLPGYRSLEKQAVVAGGGTNHRMGLYDAFLIKDNHLAATNIGDVVNKCRSYNPDIPLEIEVDSIEQLEVVVQHKPDLILLDNFEVEDIKLAKEIAGDIALEISGGVTLDNVVEYAKTNVKYIAVGAITHSAKALDIGFDYDH